MAGFFGANSSTLGGLPLGGGSNDPITQAILSRFPQLRSQPSSGGNALQGYQWSGTDFGQGQGGIGSVSMFEGAKGGQSESITGGLALGTLGKSSSQVAPGGAPLGTIPAFPQPQLADLGSPQMTQFEESQPGGEQSGGGSVNLGALVDAGTGIFNWAQTPTAQPQQPAPVVDSERQWSDGRDLSTLGGSFFNGPIGQAQQFGGIQNVPTEELLKGVNTSDIPNINELFAPSAGGRDYSWATGSPSGIPQGALGELGINTSLPGSTDWLGAAQGGAGALGGLYNLFGGVQGGDPGAAAMGGLQSIGGLTSLLQNSPGLAASLGLDASGALLGGVGGAVGGLGGLYSLYRGIQSGDPIQMATGALSAYMGGASLYGAITGTTAPGILTGLSTIAPQAMASIASAISGTTVAATAPASTIASTISAAASAWALPVAAVVVFVTEVIANMERERIMDAGFTNNPIKGALYSASTEGLANANALLGSLGGNLQGADTFDLANVITGGMNNLMPYFATAQGGRGPIRASDTLTGGHGSSKSEPLPGGDLGAYQKSFEHASQGLAQVVNELLRRGVTYEQLGQLPVSQDWATQTLDAGNRPEDMYAMGGGRYDAEAAQLQALARQFGQQPGAGQWVESGSDESGPKFTFTSPSEFRSGLAGLNLTPLDMLRAAQGAGAEGPDAITKAGGSVTGMYGGPLWAALARSGAGGDQNLMNLIQQNFDPWVNARHSTAADLYHSLDPVITPILQGRPDTSMWSAAGGGVPIGGPRAAAAPNYWDTVLSPQAQQYQQQMTDYQTQLDEFFRNALTPQPFALPSVETAQLLPPGMAGSGGGMSGGMSFAPNMVTGGGLTPEQLEWLKSQGWLAG
jgi:hypothetical protein